VGRGAVSCPHVELRRRAPGFACPRPGTTARPFVIYSGGGDGVVRPPPSDPILHQLPEVVGSNH
jgi:hypothetical protein